MYVTVAVVSPAVAVPIVGVSGTDAGVTELDAEDAVDVPLIFTAVTVYVRAVPEPTVSDTVIGLVALVAVLPDEEVAVYVETDAPPVAPAVNGTDTFALPEYDWALGTEAVPIVGACGTVVAVKAADVVAAPVADTLVGVTVVV